METANVIKSAIPRIVPVVRYDDVRTMFIKVLSALHTRDSAKVTAPAERRRKSSAAQTPINFLETIVDAR